MATVKPVKCAPCPAKPPPATLPAPVVATPGSCLLGKVRTAGDMVLVVQRAKVVVRVEAWGGELRTDSQGLFVYCLPTGQPVAPVRGTVEVSKPPFRPSQQEVELLPGQHRGLEFALEAEGLTN